MRRVAVIYNPASGQQSNHRKAMMDEVLEVFRSAGVEAEAVATTAPGSAAQIVGELLERKVDTVIACGGDGTVHEVMQDLVGGNTALGVLPLGTANALAMNLGLPLSPVEAARKLLRAVPTRISVGRIFYQDSGVERSRYFTVAAGVGADAQLMYRLDTQLKRKFGYALYAVEGLKILATDPFPLFDAAFKTKEGRPPRVEKVSQLLAVRIRNFGGMLHTFAPGATLLNGRLTLVAFKTRSRWHYLRFLAAVLGRRHTFNGRIELLDAMTVECRERPGTPQRMYVEADGEVLGSLPVRMEIVPDALVMLIPPQAEP